jgi:pimeloyl-ACP methyl ester carboxylesterase
MDTVTSRDGTRIAFDRLGEGPPVVIVSAGPTDRAANTTELFADDVAAFLQAIGVERAHVGGLSLGAATGMWLAAKYRRR